MRRVALLLTTSLLLLSSCKRYVVRDASVYDAELAWFEQAGTQTAAFATKLVERHCECDEDGYFTDLECEELAENIVVIRARMEWHEAMARYNAGLTEERPPKEPPEIPPAESLCPEKEEDDVEP